jgi:uncharacterized protein
MKILVDITHPKDVNIFRNVIYRLEEKGHKVKIVASNKENVLEILDAYELNYVKKNHYKGLLKKASGMLINDYIIYKVSRAFKPDIFTSFGSPYAAQVSRLLGKKHISFSDTDSDSLILDHFAITTLLFSEVNFVPSCHRNEGGKKQKKFNGYYELAYLHPKYFYPDTSIRDKLILHNGQKYIILRFSALTAHHDIHAHGFSFKNEHEIAEYVEALQKFGSVFITSEIKLSQELEKYKIQIPADKFHSFLSFSSLYIGEGASMASEAAILGIPSIYVSNTRRGYLDELEEKYDLAYTVKDKDKALEKALSILNEKDFEKKWQSKRSIMLKDKMDTVDFMVNMIEKYGNM